MQSLSDRIAAFLKLADACLEWFDSPTSPPKESHPLFAGITPPEGFDGQDDYSEALDTIPHEILENGGWENELIEQARSIASELARQEWGKDAVKTLLAFIRALKQRRSIDRELREQVRAGLEDVTEYLRIDAGKPDGGKADGGKPDNGKPLDNAEAALSIFLASNRDASEDDALVALETAGFERSRAWLQKQPAWDEHFGNRIREYVNTHPEVTGPKQIGDGLGGYSKGTICDKQAYKEQRSLLQARRAEKAVSRHRQKLGKRNAGTKSVIWRMVNARVKNAGEHKSDFTAKLMRDTLRLTSVYHRRAEFREAVEAMTDGELTAMIDRARKAKDSFVAWKQLHGGDDYIE